tara:strand:- start:3045 stop:3320 length:276 start_codon:yes stop_codon:yes gene_type:complete
MLKEIKEDVELEVKDMDIEQILSEIKAYKTKEHTEEWVIDWLMEYLLDEVNRTELTEDTCETNDDFIMFGRKEFAECVLARLKIDFGIEVL